VMPISLVIGRLNTLNAYTCPMHKCIANAAGGISQRLNLGCAMVRSLSKTEVTIFFKFFS
ncbi:MAG: hypothetical protein ACYTXE_38670, partial [Nostoc sp.]